MAVQFFGKRPAGLSAIEFIDQVRENATGSLFGGDLTFPQLNAAVTKYGLKSSDINESAGDTASAKAKAAVDAMVAAVKAGNPVIALVRGAALNRKTCNDPNGTRYAGHFVVVRGVSADGKLIYVNDTDERTEARLEAICAVDDWINGGERIALSRTRFTQALQDEHAIQGGRYGIIVKR
jgi:hypothetical protein